MLWEDVIHCTRFSFSNPKTHCNQSHKADLNIRKCRLNIIYEDMGKIQQSVKNDYLYDTALLLLKALYNIFQATEIQNNIIIKVWGARITNEPDTNESIVNHMSDVTIHHGINICKQRFLLYPVLRLTNMSD